MNVPSYEALMYKDTAIKVIRELCENTAKIEQEVALEQKAFNITSSGDVYLLGIGGYDGTNAGEAGVKTLQEVITDLQG